MNGFEINPDLSIRLKAYIDSLQQKSYTVENLPEIQSNLLSENVLLQHESIYGLRKMLSLENPPIQQVLLFNLAPTIINIIDQFLTTWIVHQGWWILTNLATGSTEQITILVQWGVIELLVKQLKTSELKIVEQIVYFCGNLAADCQEFRDALILKGAFTQIVHQFDKIKDNQGSVQIFLLTLSNIIRQHPIPPSSILLKIAPIICWSLVNHNFDNKTLQDVFWSLTYLSDKNNTELIQCMNNDKFKLLNMFMYYGNHQDLSMNLPCLRILGNICTGDDHQTQMVLDCDFLTLLLSLINSESNILKREACWALSNVAAGNSSQVSLIISNSKLMERLFQMWGSENMSIQKEIHFILTNLTENGDINEIFNISDDLLQTFANRLQQHNIEEQTVNCITSALEKLILQNCPTQRQLIDKIKKLKIEDLLKKTTFYKNQSNLKKKINKLINDIEIQWCSEY